MGEHTCTTIHYEPSNPFVFCPACKAEGRREAFEEVADSLKKLRETIESYEAMFRQGGNPFRGWGNLKEGGGDDD